MSMFTLVLTALLLQTSGPDPVPVAASVLPPSRHAVVSGDPVTFFAAMVNQGAGEAVNCRIEIGETGPFTYTYRAFDPATNSFIAEPNTPVAIPGGETQIFVLGFEFDGVMPRTSIEPAYVCDNGEALAVHVLTSISLAASVTAEPDILALASTNGPPGVNNGGVGNSVFAISITNLNGSPGTGVPIEVIADTIDRTFNVRLLICELDPLANCLSPRADSIEVFLNGRESRSFGIWVGGHTSTTAHLYDAVRIRPIIRNPTTEEIYGSTSVAHLGQAFRGYCGGRYPGSPWTGAIEFQTASQVGDDWQISTRRDDVNFYGDGEGGFYAVPVDGIGPRYAGSVSDPFFIDPDVGCLEAASNNSSLIPIPASPGAAADGVAWAGRLRWGSASLWGRVTQTSSDTVIANSLRGTFTMTDDTVHPVDFTPSNDSIRTPVGGFSGSYQASFIGAAGVDLSVDGWTVDDQSVTGTVVFSGPESSNVQCELAISHAPVILRSHFDEEFSYENYRRATGELTNCDDEDALGTEGTYDGIMVYQPMTVAGDPDENGLEVILRPSDPDRPQHLLWFLLRQ